MKDWKSDLLALKIITPEKIEATTPKKVTSKDAKTIAASFIKPLEVERKILSLIKHIEALSGSLAKIAPFPLVKGNSKQIKQYQKDIKILKEEFTSLCYKFKPSLVSGTKVHNTNALIIEMKYELQQRDARYQKLLIKEQQSEHERLNNELQLKLENERAEARKKEKAEERKQKVIEKNKKILISKAQAFIKEFKIIFCNECNKGNVIVPCNKCHGTKRLSQARKGIISERFYCDNLKPSCQFCGGLGIFSKHKEGLTYECDACTNGKKVKPCKTCKGTGLTTKGDGSIPKNEVLNNLESNKVLASAIQKLIGK